MFGIEILGSDTYDFLAGIGEMLGTLAGQQHMRRMLHDRLGQQNRIFDGAHTGHRAGLAGVAFHQRGIQFVTALGVVDRAFAGIEQRRVFQHGDAGDDRLAGAAAALQYGIAGIERGVQGFFVADLVFRRKLCPGDDSGTAVDDEGGFRRCGGNGRHQQDSDEYGGFHDFIPTGRLPSYPIQP